MHRMQTFPVDYRALSYCSLLSVKYLVHAQCSLFLPVTISSDQDRFKPVSAYSTNRVKPVPTYPSTIVKPVPLTPLLESNQFPLNQQVVKPVPPYSTTRVKSVPT